MNLKPCEVCLTPDKDARHRLCKPCTLAHYTRQADAELARRWAS
jgi:hypothetical protein